MTEDTNTRESGLSMEKTSSTMTIYKWPWQQSYELRVRFCCRKKETKGLSKHESYYG